MRIKHCSKFNMLKMLLQADSTGERELHTFIKPIHSRTTQNSEYKLI